MLTIAESQCICSFSYKKRRGCSAVLVPKAYLITENSFLNFMDNKMRVDNGFTTSHILIYSQLTIPTWIVQAGKL